MKLQQEKYNAPAVKKMLDIIEMMADQESGKGFTINEISKITGIPLNSVYRICIELEKRKYLERDPESGIYRLGMGFYYIGMAVANRIDIRSSARPIMDHLRDECGETVHLCIYQNKKMVLLEQSQTNLNIKLCVDTGSVLYPHASAFGKCILAYLDEGEFQDYIQEPLVSLTENTITDPNVLRSEIQRIRIRNIAYDHEEYIEGLNCIGSAVFDKSGKVTAAIGIVALNHRFKIDTEKNEKLVFEAAQKLSETLGCDKKTFLSILSTFEKIEYFENIPE